MPSERALEAFRAGDDDTAERLARDQLRDAAAARDVPAEVDAQCMLARVALRRGELDVVWARAEQARAAATAAGDRRAERMPLHLQAAAKRMLGELDTARALYRQSIALNDELGETRMAALEHRNLAYVELQAGDPARALALIAESQQRLAGVDVAALQPYLTFDEATVAAVRGDAALASRRLAQALEQFRVAGVVPDPDDVVEIERLRASLAHADDRG